MTTAQKTWTAGDVLTAADQNTYARGGQEMGYASITTTSSTFTTEADVTSLTVTWTAISTRVYMLEFHGNVRSTVANDQIAVYITDSSNTHVQQGFSTVVSASDQSVISVKARLTGLSGSVTYKIRAQRFAGTGNGTITAAATQPAFFSVLDVGAN